MDQEFKKINLNLPKPGKRGFFQKKVKIFMFFASAIVIFFLLWSFFNSSTNVFQFAISKVTTNPLKSTDNRVNILLLGNAGGKHDGPDLTDSIIVVSYNLKTNRAALISIPRDLWLEGISGKVNSAWEDGEQRPEGGLKFAEDKIDDILGIPIHYGIRINFDGFSRAIDLVDGIDVEVPKTFDDFNYPITGKEDDLCGLQEKEMEINEEQAKVLKLKPGKQKVLVDSTDKIASSAADFACRFEHIYFDKGREHMNGETALKFVRSRMGTNGEGSDFARSRRQQLVLQAFRDKVLSLQTLFNLSKITGLYKTLGDSVETDIEKERFLDFYNLVKNMSATSSIVLGDLGDGKSVFEVGSPAKYGAYVLVSPDADNATVKSFVKEKLTDDDLKAVPAK